METVRKTTICEGCDSEYTLLFKKSGVSDVPAFCPFCSNETSFVNDELTDDDFTPDDDEEDEY
ncbi:MAG: hypothetical protein ACRDE2_09870 [Chitinophagaceae bacterium]